MKSNFHLLLLACILSFTTQAQKSQPPSISLGDIAPPLRGIEWIKGGPIQSFEKGKVYVLEFWAPWCIPCVASIPRLSALADEYKDKITIIGIDSDERKYSSRKKVMSFVDSMGNRMNYHVAVQDDSNFVERDWRDATGERGLPTSFVVNAEGRLAWIGYPSDLNGILPKILNNTWDIKESLAKRNLNKYLAEMDDSLNSELMIYRGGYPFPTTPERPDSALVAIGKMIRDEPKLKYAPFMAYNTFDALLKTDLNKAYAYGKEVIVTHTYDFPAYDIIIELIDTLSTKLNFPEKIFELGAEAYQRLIESFVYPEIADIYKLYHKMAKFYWRAKNKEKAIETEEKAIEALKSKKDYSRSDFAVFETQLQQYKNM